MTVPTKQDLLADQATPQWARELLLLSGRIDPVDYINALETLLAEARQRYSDLSLDPTVASVRRMAYRFHRFGR